MRLWQTLVCILLAGCSLPQDSPGRAAERKAAREIAPLVSRELPDNGRKDEDLEQLLPYFAGPPAQQ